MNAPQPNRTPPRAPQTQHRGPRVAPPTSSTFEDAHPDSGGTAVALVGLVLTALTLSGQLPSELARYAAIGSGLSLLVGTAIEARRGLQNLIRADIMALAALYFLTLFEFFFPQPNFDRMIGVRATEQAIYAVLVGLGGLLVGRHLWQPVQQPFAATLTREIPPQWLISMLLGCFTIGFFHQIIAVNFDVVEWVEYMMAPRFSQPWQRGRLGDWKALLVELQLFIYLVPPLAGIILARRHRYGAAARLVVMAAFLFTLFYGFSGGTRNVFASFLVTFVIGYAFALPDGRRKEIIAVSAGAGVTFLVAIVLMLEFRTVGFRNWLDGKYVPPDTKERTLFIDYNLYAICRIVEVFPKYREYLGLEVPYIALVRPIPRAIWPGKPEGLSTTIEETLGVEGLTISASFVGEAWMAAGYIGVAATGLLLGALTGWWSYLVSRKNSELGILIYASGFFAAVISMRSIFVFTTALLPTVAALVIGSYLVQTIRERRQHQLQPVPRRPTSRPPAR